MGNDTEIDTSPPTHTYHACTPTDIHTGKKLKHEHTLPPFLNVDARQEMMGGVITAKEKWLLSVERGHLIQCVPSVFLLPPHM